MGLPWPRFVGRLEVRGRIHYTVRQWAGRESEVRMKPSRHDGRRADQIRPVKLTPGFVPPADGSCLIEMGGTRVICTASIAADVPKWMEGKGVGWLTAEYGMLPASTGKRKPRPIAKPDGRATEIQRLIGRSLRSAVDLSRLGEHTIYLDCDVLTADGGTRTAAITGAYVALALAVRKAQRAGVLPAKGLTLRPVAAVSVGIVHGRPLLDLDYHEDVAAEVDMNVAMTGGKYIDAQATGEHGQFTDSQLRSMLRLARRGIGQLLKAQAKALAPKE
jgi:ribonuclease PH